MIVNLQEIKLFLQVDHEEEDLLIESLIAAAEVYLYNATGKKFTSENSLAILYCKVLINDWYKNRDLMEQKGVSDKVRFTLQSILLQLKHSEV
ncbi:head-tail connector protein [Clostridium sp.]|uniref:head-tail connector protein n=1 Tax=Clostridium sp. TaxID=1506 RepID=UPI00399699E0